MGSRSVKIADEGKSSVPALTGTGTAALKTGCHSNARDRLSSYRRAWGAARMISLSHNWLFIHISRTAGNSIQSVLAPYSDDNLTRAAFQDGTDRFGVSGPYTGNKHFRLQDYAGVVPPEIFSRLFKFAVVRNPWARAISWFFMPLKWISAGRQPRWSAEEFRTEIEHMPSMAPMLKVNGIPARLDMLLHFETLEADFAALIKQLGIETSRVLPHRNKGYSSENWQHYYLRSPDLVDLVSERFAEDIELFGYHAASVSSVVV